MTTILLKLVTESRNEQSHLDSMILARLHSNLLGGWDLKGGTQPFAVNRNQALVRRMSGSFQFRPRSSCINLT